MQPNDRELPRKGDAVILRIISAWMSCILAAWLVAYITHLMPPISTVWYGFPWTFTGTSSCVAAFVIPLLWRK